MRVMKTFTVDWHFQDKNKFQLKTPSASFSSKNFYIFFHWFLYVLIYIFLKTCIPIFFSEAIQNMTQGNLELTDGNPGTAGIFATYPAPYLTTLGGFGDQVNISNLW